MVDEENGEVMRELRALRAEVSSLRQSVRAMKRAAALKEKQLLAEKAEDDDERRLRDLPVKEMHALVERITARHLQNAIKTAEWMDRDAVIAVVAKVDIEGKPGTCGVPIIRFGFSYDSGQRLRRPTAYWAAFETVVEIGNVNVRPFSVHKRVHERLEDANFMETLQEAVSMVCRENEQVRIDVMVEADGPRPYRLLANVNVFNVREREKANEGK